MTPVSQGLSSQEAAQSAGEIFLKVPSLWIHAPIPCELLIHGFPLPNNIRCVLSLGQESLVSSVFPSSCLSVPSGTLYRAVAFLPGRVSERSE